MKIHTFELECDVCGGTGMGTIQTAGAAWDSRSTIVHTDPRICRDYLQRERERLEKLATEAAPSTRKQQR